MNFKNRIYSIVGILYLLGMMFIASSCSSTSDVGGGSDGQDKNVQEEMNAIANVCTDWEADAEGVLNSMKKYQVESQENNYLAFSHANGTRFSYAFKDNKLIASAVIIPVSSENKIVGNKLAKYQYVGDVNSSMIYVQNTGNTMMSAFDKLVNSQSYHVYGFAPITSELYEKKKLPSVTTISAGKVAVRTATLKGEVANMDEANACGFLYADNVDMNDAKSIKKTVSQGSFTVDVTGLSMGTTYYYQAFAIVDGVYYYGEIESFKTETVPTYKVGDLYPNNTNPIGVVFSTSSDGVNGKIISLEYKWTKWDEMGIFSSQYGCTSNTDGKSNTSKMPSSLPLKKWISSLGTGWYCPSVNEWKTIGANYDAVNSTFVSQGYSLSGVYWSSTERSASTAYVVLIHFDRYETGYTTYHTKDGSNSVRAIKEF